MSSLFKDLLAVLGAVFVALGMVFVMYVGYLYDEYQNEEREREERMRKWEMWRRRR